MQGAFFEGDARKREGPILIRNYVLMPLLLLYMATLILAAWQTDVSLRFLHRPHTLAFELLESVGIRPGMRVFGGSRDPLKALVRARCTVVHGIDSHGSKTQIYPIETCPPDGLRWKPVVYEHMIVHWTAWLRHGDYQSNLSELGDHFCQEANDPNFTHVELTLALPLIDYSTGEKWIESEKLGRVECRR
ncbi:MAG: hypothetical protein H8E78_10725 [Proteobacteria bacterium]|nr:hypothetical protein [Pseudomonadota bacterium]